MTKTKHARDRFQLYRSGFAHGAGRLASQRLVYLQHMKVVLKKWDKASQLNTGGDKKGGIVGAAQLVKCGLLTATRDPRVTHSLLGYSLRMVRGVVRVSRARLRGSLADEPVDFC